MAALDQAQQSNSTPSTSTLNLNSIMIGTDQFQALVDFYGRVFGRPADMNDGGYAGWQVGSCFLSVGAHSEIHGKAKEPARVMLNLETVDVRGEFARLKGLGVAVVKEPYEMGENLWIATLADPDGNYLQLMMPWEG
jgi:predicted enzyme related to lactoylglutathione lyase